MSNLKWVLYIWGQKGWMEESTYDNQEDAKYYLKEWKEEFPNCKFKLIKEV